VVLKERNERNETKRGREKERRGKRETRDQAPIEANMAFLDPPFLLLIVINAPLSSAGGKNPSVCFIGSVAISPPGLTGMSVRLDEAGRRRLADRVGTRERGDRGG